jgi:hypothetical protein
MSGWRMAEQYFRYSDFELETKPHNDGYVLTVKLGFKTRRVFFDPAGRVTHVLNLNAPEPPADPKLI